MCEYFSCIIDRNLKVWWLKTTVSHEEIVKKAKLKDDKLQDRDFVRIEIIPKDMNKITRDKKDWTFKVDEVGTLPKWYLSKQKKCEVLCWAEWKESIKINLALAGESVKLNGEYCLAIGATVKAWGNATVKAWGNATVEAWGNATVKAGGNATVKAWGNATVEAGGNATVEAWGNATVEAWGNATVKAGGNATVEAGGNATVEAWDNATVKAWDNAFCFIYEWGKSVKAELKSDTAIIRFGNKVIVGASLEVEKKKVKDGV